MTQGFHQNFVVRAWVSTAFVALFAFLLVSHFSPLQFGFGVDGLDPSWSAALAERIAAGASQGRDLVFTGGPLSPLYSRYFQPETAAYIIGFSFVFWIAFVYAALSISFERNVFVLLLLLLPFVSVASSIDALFITLPFLFTIGQFWRSKATSIGVALFYALACAALVAAKFSVMPLALLSCILLDIRAVTKRSLPVFTIALWLFLFAIHVGTGSEASTFVQYVVMSFDTSAGYTEAMGSKGNILRLALYLATVSVFASVLLVSAWNSVWEGGWLFGETARLLMFAGLLFMTFKAGFVRHDLHELTAWAGLSWAACVFLATRWPGRQAGAARISAIVVAGVLVTSFIGPILAFKAERVTYTPAIARLQVGLEEARLLGAALLDPSGWWAEQIRRRHEAQAKLSTLHPYPRFEGGVDMLASEQGKLIANQSDFTPRPTVQEYTTYSRRTIAANRAFFEGSKAPKYLLMDVATIDGRLPSLVEGPQWPVFFRYYDVTGEHDGQVVLTRRATPRPDLLGEPRVSTLTLAETRALTVQGPVFAKLSMKKTLLGSLANIAFKLNPVMLTLTVNSGDSFTFRLIPAIAEGGFLLSPLVQNSYDLKRLLDSAQMRGTLPTVTAIRVDAGPMGWLFYQSEMTLTLQPFAIPDAGAEVLKMRTDVDLLLASNTLRPPGLAITSEGFFAHPPSDLTATTDGRSRLSIGFGIRSSAYELTDGVCFKVVAEAGATPTPVFERCLDPRAAAADQGTQNAEITLPAGTTGIRLQTACRGNCAYDWSYWSKAQLQ